jgi:hypothetical protein
MKQDPRGPRDFYAPPQSPSSWRDSNWHRATRLLALLYLVSAAATLLFVLGVVKGHLPPNTDLASAGFWVGSLGSAGIGWLLSFTAFMVRLEERTPRLGVFVLLSGLLTCGLFALVSLPVKGDPGR